MIVRALPKPPKDIKQVCCKQRYEQINRHYHSIKESILLLDTNKPLTVEWACTFCGTWHEIHAYQESGKQTYVSLDAVDIDEMPVEV